MFLHRILGDLYASLVTAQPAISSIMRQPSLRISRRSFSVHIVSLLPHSLALLARLSSLAGGLSAFPFFTRTSKLASALTIHSRVTLVLQYVHITEKLSQISLLLLTCTWSTLSSLELIDRLQNPRVMRRREPTCFLARCPVEDVSRERSCDSH